MIPSRRRERFAWACTASPVPYRITRGQHHLPLHGAFIRGVKGRFVGEAAGAEKFDRPHSQHPLDRGGDLGLEHVGRELREQRRESRIRNTARFLNHGDFLGALDEPSLRQDGVGCAELRQPGSESGVKRFRDVRAADQSHMRNVGHGIGCEGRYLVARPVIKGSGGVAQIGGAAGPDHRMHGLGMENAFDAQAKAEP